jgi:hypothetical protein
MADFEEIETQAKDHSQQVDEGIQKLDELADEHAGGQEKGLIDGAASAAEREISGQPQAASQDQPPAASQDQAQAASQDQPQAASQDQPQAGAQPQPPNQ